MQRPNQIIVQKAYNIVLARFIPELSEQDRIRDNADRVFNILVVGTSMSGATWVVANRINPDPNVAT